MAEAEDNVPQIAQVAENVRRTVLRTYSQRMFFALVDDEDERDVYEHLAAYITSSCTDKDRYGLYLDESKRIEQVDEQFLQNADIVQCFNSERNTVLGFGVDIGIMVMIFNCQEDSRDFFKVRDYLMQKASLNSLSLSSNARLYALSPLTTLPTLRIWTRFRRFRCMDAMNWLSGHPMPFSLDLFTKLIWPDEYLSHETDELDYMLYKFETSTRSCLANLFIRLILLVCGTGSFLDYDGAAHMFRGKQFESKEEAQSFLKKAHDNVLLYANPLWNTPDMPVQGALDPIELQTLMSFVSERMKLSLESYVSWKETELRNNGEEQPDLAENGFWITPEDFSLYVVSLFMDVFTDYLALYYCATESWNSVQEFLEMFGGTLAIVGGMFIGNMVIDAKMDHIEKFITPLYEAGNNPGSFEDLHQRLRDTVENWQQYVEEDNALEAIQNVNPILVYELQQTMLRYRNNGVPFPGFEMMMNNETMTPQWGYFRGCMHRFNATNFRAVHPMLTTEEDIWEAFRWEGAGKEMRQTYYEHDDEAVQRSKQEDHSAIHDIPLLLTETSKGNDGEQQVTNIRAMMMFPPPHALVLSQYMPQLHSDIPVPKWMTVKREYDLLYPWNFGGGTLMQIYGTEDIHRIHSGLNIRRPYSQQPSEVLRITAKTGQTVHNHPQIMQQRNQQGNQQQQTISQHHLTGSSSQQVNPQQSARRELVNYAAVIEDYEQDLQDSDNEFEECSGEIRHRDNNYPFLNNVEDVEAFYQEILGWVVDPDENGFKGHINSSHRSNGHWLKDFFRGPGKFILTNVTHAPDLKAYTMHMMAMLMLTCRANVMQALVQDKFRPLKAPGFMADLHHAQHIEDCGIEFLDMEIDAVAATPELIHFSASSQNENLNRYILDDCLMGLTLCIAQVERGPDTRRCPIPRKSKRRSQNMTGLMFCLIRRVAVHHLETQEEIELEPEQAAIEQLEVRMSMNRTALKEEGFSIEPGHSIRFVPVCSLASEIRILKAIPRLALIPDNFRERMFGDRLVKVPYNVTEVRYPPSNSTLTTAMTIGVFHETPQGIQQMIETQTDAGSRDYLVRCANRDDCEVHETHFNALIQLLRVLGDAHPGSSGMGMIKGPPGTGKTKTILHLIGAILHHSLYGHMVPEDQQVTHERTPVDDTRMRRRNNPTSLKILVVASSNAAADNVLKKLHEEGIPDGNGGTLRPRMMRIARHNHVPPAPLGQYLVRSEARLYDEDHENRQNPRLHAKRQCADECIIFITTASCAGSSQLKELNQTFDIVIHDEAGFTLEWEALIPLTAACTHRDLGYGRLFYFAVGDEKQLPALCFIQNMILQAGVMRDAPFDIWTAQRSLFERLILARRVTHSLLYAQFRMHPSISRITSTPFYNHYFECPVPIDQFEVRYNQPQLYNDGFHPMTFLDTSRLPELDRAERDDKEGTVTNNTEADIIVQLVDMLFDLVGDEVNNQIAVITPYSAQVDIISDALRLRSRALARNNHRQEDEPIRNVSVSSVDSMQGSQKNVVIFSMTRSNRDGYVGFLKEMKRLNVSLTRARYLNIILGDMSTMDTTPQLDGRNYGKRSRFSNAPVQGRGNRGRTRVRSQRGIPSIMNIYDRCSTHDEPAARVAQVTRNRQFNNGNNGNNQLAYNIEYLPQRSIPATRQQRETSSAAGPTATLRIEPSFNFFTLYSTNAANNAADNGS